MIFDAIFSESSSGISRPRGVKGSVVSVYVYRSCEFTLGWRGVSSRLFPCAFRALGYCDTLHNVLLLLLLLLFFLHTINFFNPILAVTAYSQSAAALNDMLRLQLHLTQQQVNNSKRLLASLSSSLKPNYHYTTLESTKHFIAKNRPKIITLSEVKKKW